MSYVSGSESERREMLKNIGVSGFDDLIQEIPEDLRLKKPLNLPPGKSEFEVISALKKLKGAYAVVVLSTQDTDKIIAARNSSPLVLGVGEDEYVLASDASAIVEHTKQVIYLDEIEGQGLTEANESFLIYDSQTFFGEEIGGGYYRFNILSANLTYGQEYINITFAKDDYQNATLEILLNII